MEKIVVVDFGSQYNQVIVKALRKLNVYAELVYYKELKDNLVDVKGIILSGGPCSVYEKDAYKLDIDILDLGIPVLGVCYGMQYLAHFYGGEVKLGDVREYGDTTIQTIVESDFLFDIPKTQNVWMSHDDYVSSLGEDFEVLAQSSNYPAIIAHKNKPIYGVQFHIEVSHTKYGIAMLSNFVFGICNIKKEYYLEQYLEVIKQNIKEVVGDKKIICALSGGVDSSVVAKLLAITVPEQVYYFYVDTGLMRKNETKELEEEFIKKHNLDVKVIDGKTQMLSALKGVRDPEAKRKIIGKVFIDIFEKTISEITTNEKVELLAQGTLYSDIIESGTNSSHTIKSHHNVGGLPEDMNFEVVEPLKYLFKEEVREIGTLIGLPDSIIKRQPFPGPGFGIRIMGEVTNEKIDILREADAIVRLTLDQVADEFKLWQYFCVLTNTKSVGVKGDKRAYEYVLAIRAVNSNDAMTANFAHIDFEILGNISNEITNKVVGVTRVVYDITSKPPGTIEWE